MELQLCSFKNPPDLYAEYLQMKQFLFLLLFIPFTSLAQEHLYVNTDNLVVRDRPEKRYNVYAILHPGCEVDMGRADKGYKNNKEVINKFYRITFTYRYENRRSLTVSGWVEKKYMVRSRAQITVSSADAIAKLPVTMVPNEDDPKQFNCAAYPFPKYKGGEKHFDVTATSKRIYHTGARGGCYYLSPKGDKRYVDPKFCK